MKRLSVVIATFVTLLVLASPGHATVYLNETNWISGTLHSQNLPGTSAWFSSSSGSLTASSGAMRLIGTATGAAITYFTPTSSSTPLKLNVGDTLTANIIFTFNGVQTGTTSQGYRLGIFNNYDGSNSPARVTADGSPFSSSGQGAFVEGYALFLKMYSAFGDDQPIDVKKRTNISSTSLLGTTGDFTTLLKPRLTNTLFTGFIDLTNYTFQTVIQRTGLGSSSVTMTWSNMSNGATLSAAASDNVATNFSFDTIEFRGSSGQYPLTNIFKQVKIEMTSAPVAASIITQPPDLDVASGSDATIVCGANGTLPLSYWWYSGTNADYSLNTLVGSGTVDFPTAGHIPTPNPSLTISNVQVADAGSYSVIISNAYGSVTSSVATLLVADVPPGIASQPQDLNVIPGQFATFSVIATGSQPLSYQWYHNTNSPLANATNSAITLVNVSTNDAGTYSVTVSNPISIVTSSYALLHVDTNPSAPVFIIQPASVSVRVYDSASFTAAAVGDAPITYQWYTNSLPIAGATSPTLNFPSVQPTDPGTYTLVASNAIGSTSSSNAVLTATSRTPPLPVIPATNFFVTDFGAYGDGISNNAWAIQNAISNAAAAGGGSVIIPAGGTLSTYMSGPIVVSSNNINLQVNSGAKLIMLPRFATATVTNWPSPSQPLIDISGRHDVAITGSGTIDGNAGFGSTNWWQSPTLDESLRPKIINVHNVSSNILIQGVTLQNSPVFHILLKGGNVGITLDGVKWNTPGNAPNTDAMDIGSTNVLVQNCTIYVGDDNVQMGSSDQPAADITVSNCTFGTGHGVSIGSPTGAGVHELLVSNCWFVGTANGIRMKSDITSSGGLAENLKYMDISMTNVGYPILIYSYYDLVGTPNNITPTTAANSSPVPVVNATPWWRNITIRNLTATNSTGSNIAGIIWGRQEACISNVTLQNVSFVAPSKSFNVYNARNVRILDSNLTAPNSGTNTLNLYNAEVVVTNTAPNANVFTLGGLTRSGTNNALTFINGRAAINEAPLLNGGPITLAKSTLTLNPASVNSTNNPITVVDASTLAVTSGNNALNGALSGSGPLTLNVPASTLLTLRADSSGFGGALVVSNSGTLLVNNTTGSGTGTGAVTVVSTANLGGNGAIGGPVTVDGTLAPGTSPGTLTINNSLVVHGGAALQYELGTSSDLVAVTGDLTLGGTLNITDSGGFANNSYNLFTYGGILTYNGLTVGTKPNAGYHYTVDTGRSNSSGRRTIHRERRALMPTAMA